MDGVVTKHAHAKRDLIEHYVYLAEQAGSETAERFLVHADETFSELALHPEMGVALPVLAVTCRAAQMAGERV